MSGALRGAVTAAAFVTLAVPAASAASCAPRESVVAKLGAEFGERAMAAGLSTQGVVEVYANDRTGTFTVVLTRPDGMACMVASGEDFGAMPARAKGDPA